MFKSKILTMLVVTALILPLSSKAKAYDNGYNNAAMVSLAALLVSGSELSSAYNNTPRRYRTVNKEQREAANKPRQLFGKNAQAVNYAESQ